MLPATIEVQTARNPFEGQRVHSYAAEGETLETIILSQGLRLDGVYTVAVLINGELVPERWFPRVRPKAGTLVVLRVIPRGGEGGKAFLSILIGILALAAAWVTGGASLALIGGLGGAELAAVAGLAIGGVLSIVTGIQSLVAPPPSVPFSGSVPQSQDSAALTGTRNTARLYGPIRTVLGQYRIYPDLLGKPFAERVGKDSILRLLMCFGYGPMDITDIRIGEKPIEELIPSSKYNVYKGWDDDADLSIFRDEVDSDGTFAPELPRTADYVTDKVTLTTKGGPEEISIDFQFAAGLIAFSDQGKPKTVTVRFEVEEKESVLTTWTVIGDPTLGVDYEGSTDTGVTKVSDGVFDFKLKERGLVTRGLRWTVPVGSTAGVSHDVRVSRVSTTTSVSETDSIFSDAKVSVIRTIRPHIAAQIPNLAKIELEINADETGLSNIIDNLSAICTSIAPKFDAVTGSWGPAHASSAAYNASMFPTRNAAWLFAQVLRGPANSRPIDDSRIDGRGLADWAGNLDGSGQEPISGTDGLARNLDAVVDYTTTARKVLSDIAGAGRGALNLVDGKYSVVQDIPKDQVIQHFSPRNSRSFSGGKSFRRRPHAIRTHFVNPQPFEDGTKSYQKDELIVYDDGYSALGNHVVDLAFRGSTTPTSRLSGGPGAATAWEVYATNANLEGYQGYAVRLTTTAGDSQFFNRSTNNLAIDADVSKFVRVRMRRVTAGGDNWHGQMFFQVAGSSFAGGMDEVQSNEPDWTKGWVTVVWDMSANATWTGTIDRLRFDFVAGGSSFGSVFDIESIVVDDDTKRATEFGELSLWGVADPEQAYRDGRYHLASSKLRPEVFAIEADVEHIVCNRGDLVRVTHDVIGVGYGGARFTDVTTSGFAFRGGILDEEFNYDSGKDYAIRIRGMSTSGNDPGDGIVNIVNQNGVSSIVTPVTPYSHLAAGTVMPRVGDLVLFGERGIESLECLVQRISPRNDLTALIEMVEYNAAVYEPGVIPAHESNISLQTPPTLLTPVTPEFVGEPISDETAVSFSAAGSPEAQIIVSVITPQNASGSYAPTTHYHAEFRAKTDNSATSEAVTAWFSASRVEAVGDTKIAIRPVDEGEVYDIRVRAISDVSATASEWIYKHNHTVIGLSTPPDAPTELSVWGDAIRWNYGVKPADFAGFVVKFQAGTDSTWATGISLSTNLITDNWVQIGGRIQPGQTTIMVKAVDLGGNESALLSATKTIRSVGDLTVIESTEWTGDWPGQANQMWKNCSKNGSTGFLEADEISSNPPFWSGGASAAFWSATSSDDFWGVSLFEEMSYEGFYYIRDWYKDDAPGAWPASDQLPARIRFSELEIVGSSYEVEYRATDGDPDSHPEWTHLMEYTCWPGARELQETEWTSYDGDVRFEVTQFKITIAGGTTQGMLKAAKIVTEPLPREYRTTVDVADDGTTVVDLTGMGWRKVENVTVSPVMGADSSQGALIGEAYDLDAAQTTTEPYYVTGPKIRLWNTLGVAATGTASIYLQGY